MWHHFTKAIFVFIIVLYPLILNQFSHGNAKP